MRARGEKTDAHAAPDDPRRLGCLPIERGSDFADVADEIGVERFAAGAHRLAAVKKVSLPDLQGVQPAAAGDLIDLQFAAPLQMAGSEGTVRTGGRGVGVNAPGVNLDRVPAIRPGSGVGAGGDDARTVVGIGAGIEPGADLAREEPAIARGGGPQPGFHAVATSGDHRLVDAVGDSHRATCLARQRRGDRLHLGVRLAAETAAEIGHYHPDRGDGKSVEIGQLRPNQKWVLARRPDGEIVIARPLGNRRVWFQRILVDRRKVVLAFDDDIRPANACATSPRANAWW